MEYYDAEKGVFLPSENLDSALLVNCMQALLSDYPSIKFTSVSSDEKVGGFRLMFSEEVKDVLKKNQLTITDDFVRIYPLTTVLTICDLDSFQDPLFENDVIEAMNEQFGKVIEVMKYGSTQIVDTLKKDFGIALDLTKFDWMQKKWLVRVDVPEFYFVKKYPNRESEMHLAVSKWEKTLKIKFWCRSCKITGHLQDNNCIQGIQPEVGSENPSNKKSSEKLPEIETNSSLRLSLISSPVVRCENLSLDSINDYGEKVKKARKASEQSKKYKESRSNESTRNTRSGSLISHSNIKKEVHEVPDEKKLKIIISNVKQEILDNNKDHENRSTLEEDEHGMYFEEASDSKLFIDTASNDEETQQTGYSNQTSPMQSFSDDSEIGTKAQDNATAESRERAVPSLSPFPGPSNPVTASAYSILGAADTSILSSELQGYINHACEKCAVLDRQKLDAFLGYVKKKNRPSETAIKYTKNVDGLKEQLQLILNMRYHTVPMNQSKEDAVFIKWLEGLVSRFDKTRPSKRKRSGQ